jgi:hypothetical protein
LREVASRFAWPAGSVSRRHGCSAPGSDLAHETSYYVTFAAGVVRDVTGNAFAGISSGVFNFTTESDYVDVTAPIIIFTSPKEHVTAHKNMPA